MRTQFLHRQRGVTLIVALLFLVVVTLLTVVSVNSSTTNLKVTSNMVARQEAISAAQAVIEETISSSLFTVNPEAVAASIYPIDIDSDGTTDYTPELAPVPSCHKTNAIKTTDLDINDPEDVMCFTSGTAPNPTVESAAAAAAAGSSLCSNTEWNIRVTVEDERTGVDVAVNQGVGVRVAATDAADFCN